MQGSDSWGLVDLSPVGAISSFVQPLCLGASGGGGGKRLTGLGCG